MTEQAVVAEAWNVPDAEAEESLAKKAYERLERMIVMLDIPPGGTLSEVSLSRRLGIGRTPIREAIKKLEREGLLSILPRRGIMVTEINLAQHLKVLEVRGQLELLVARAAAKRATATQRLEMRELADRIQEAAAAGDGRWFMSGTWEFHGLPVVAANNDCIASAIQLFHGQSRRFWFAHYERYADLPEAARVHAERLRRIAEGDTAAAETATTTVMAYLEKFALSTVK
ncbi:MAG: GntR family transcriptional regulator, partial [Tistlia sp.]